MSDTSIGNTKQLMKQPNEDISKATGQFSTAADDSNEILILRKTSKSLRALVDKQQPACSRLYMSCMFDYIICEYNDHRVAYVPPNWSREEFSSQYENCRLDKIISKTDYEQVAFDDLAFTLKNPKLQLGYFSFDSVYSSCCCVDCFKYRNSRDGEIRDRLENMQEILKSFNHKISVKECRIDVSSPSNATSILPYLKPGVLEKITIFPEYDVGGWSEWTRTLRQVAILDQWKQAKELHLECGFDDEFPTEHATHFKRFQFDENLLYPDTLILIRDYILEHENAEFCLISNCDCYKPFSFEDLAGIVGTHVSPNLYHYTVLDSEYYLEFMIGDDRITIEKKKK